MATKDEWPNNHHAFCDCQECNEAWDALESEDSDTVSAGGDYDDEAAHEEDTVWGLDGWGS